MKEIDIFIKTEQRDKLGGKDCIEVKSEGKIYEKNNDTYIVYKEKLGNEDELVTTTIKMNENEISIKRFGTVNSNMIFNENKAYNSRYYTKQGTFEIEINTKSIKIYKEENKIDISINYEMNIVGMFEGYNDIQIQIREKK